MTGEQAKEILLAYRPGVDDAQEPEVAAALALCEKDAALKEWFQAYCLRQDALREKFRALAAPEGLAQQILSEFKTRIPVPWWRRRAVVGALACLVISIALASIWQTLGPIGGEDLSFNGYRQRMVRTTLRAYGMDLETNDVAQVRAYLATKSAPADFELTPALAQTPAVGCGVLAWQGRPVTMVCFRTGKPLEAGSKSDLFLFVIAKKDLRGTVCIEEKQFAKVSELATVSWCSGDKIYMLAAFTEADLKQRL